MQFSVSAPQSWLKANTAPNIQFISTAEKDGSIVQLRLGLHCLKQHTVALFPPIASRSMGPWVFGTNLTAAAQLVHSAAVLVECSLIAVCPATMSILQTVNRI